MCPFFEKFYITSKKTSYLSQFSFPKTKFRTNSRFKFIKCNVVNEILPRNGNFSLFSIANFTGSTTYIIDCDDAPP